MNSINPKEGNKMEIRRNVFGFVLIILVSSLLLLVCGKKEEAQQAPGGLPQIGPAESREVLFDGETLDGWQFKPGGWKVEDGAMALVGRGGTIWTEEQYGNFILECEFRISPKCNSGIFFRTGDINDMVQTGFEIQVQDSYGRTEIDKNDCGALYDVLAPSSNEAKPAGEWNHTVITCKDNIVTVELNGVQIINVDLDQYTTPNMNIDGTKNKFNTALKDFPRSGYIGFQDHGQPVWYRNVRIKLL